MAENEVPKVVGAPVEGDPDQIPPTDRELKFGPKDELRLGENGETDQKDTHTSEVGDPHPKDEEKLGAANTSDAATPGVKDVTVPDAEVTAEKYQEMTKKGANVEGEGKVEGVK